MWCVFEVEIDKRRAFAWCQPSPAGHPGFDTVVTTLRDGMTLIDTPDELDLGTLLFVVPDVPATS